MTSDTTKSGADWSSEESWVNKGVPDGPKTVALMPDSLAGSNLNGSLTNNFLSKANPYLWNAEPMCLSINLFINLKINFYILNKYLIAGLMTIVDCDI
jgi:hypothetical protein